MKALEGVLKEELQRLLQLQKSYLREIKNLPKGSLREKKIKGKPYLYLAFRKGREVIYEYLGKLSEANSQKLKAQIQQRRKYEALLREVRRNIKRLEKIVYGRKRAV